MARRRSESFEQQRSEILEKAAMLFAEAGFHAASMASLAQACGVSKALLYHYYQDKEHILFDVALSYVERLVAIVEEELGREPPGSAAQARVALERPRAMPAARWTWPWATASRVAARRPMA